MLKTLIALALALPISAPGYADTPQNSTNQKGSTPQSKNKGSSTIELNSFSFGASNQSAVGKSNGDAQGKVSVNEITPSNTTKSGKPAQKNPCDQPNPPHDCKRPNPKH